MDGKKACEKLLDAMQLEKASYRVGTSKVMNTDGSYTMATKPIKFLELHYKLYNDPVFNNIYRYYIIHLGILPGWYLGRTGRHER